MQSNVLLLWKLETLKCFRLVGAPNNEYSYKRLYLMLVYRVYGAKKSYVRDRELNISIKERLGKPLHQKTL